jgi:hypothetical protein
LFASAVLAPRAYSQADYPTLQAAGERPGHNTDPINYNSGQSFLQWFTPYGNLYTTPEVIDNTDVTGSIYPTNPYGLASLTGSWNNSPDGTGNLEATPTYNPGAPPLYAPRVPNYVYSSNTVTTTPGNPTAGATATFNWTFNAQSTTTPIEYGLYVWLPAGPTQTGSGYLYPLRYYVYQITYGSGQTYIDVVDTYLAGVGWVRLGNGGAPTNQVFTMAPSGTITIQLLNTIPDDSNGNPTGTTSQVVYADAAQAVPIQGTTAASPTSAYMRDASGNPVPDPTGDADGGGTSYFARIFNATNLLVASKAANGTYSTVNQSVVQAYQMNAADWLTAGVPQVLWTYSPSVAGVYNYYVTQGTATAGWNTDTTNPNYQGTSYYSETIVSGAGTDTVTYGSSTLASGQYSIYVYIPGNGGGESYGQAVNYNIYEGSNPTPVYSGTIDESKASGWVQVGAGSYPQIYNSQELTLQITNGSNNAGDVGLLAYANAVKFVTANSLSISSTPVEAQVPIMLNGGSVVLTQVVLVADESGKIHCLDYKGNSDGTTTEYWSYPSTPDPNNPTWTDPNLTLGIDGPPTSKVPVAQMPTQFNLSSACVQNVGGSYRLFIASQNGRIYCIDTEGRGDYNAATGVPGTTQRFWSYPSDYPAITQPSNLGAFQGSLAYGDTTDGLAAPTVFAAAPQGRAYSLDATGVLATRTTTVNWTYPSLNSQALPPIAMTPVLAFGNLYFGTRQNLSIGGPGTFYALNSSTGAVTWSFNSDPYPELLDYTASPPNNVLAGPPPMLDFVSGPVAVSAALLTESGEPSASNMIYVLNQNNYLYGLNATTGAIETYNFAVLGGTETLAYRTNELGITTNANLGFQWQTVYNPPGDPHGTNPSQYPVVEVPTSEGHLYAMFANLWDYNQNTVTPYLYNSSYPTQTTVPVDALAWGYSLLGNQISSPAFSNNRMIVNSDTGQMYVFTPNAANAGQEVSGNAPGQQVVPPNQIGPPDAFKYLKIRFITAAGYQALRNNPATTAFSDVLANTGGIYQLPSPPSGQNYYSFEYGDTVYMLVYGFPFETTDANGTTITPPIVNLRISTGGNVLRQLENISTQFANATASPNLFNPNSDTWPGNWNSTVQDGYAVFAIPFTEGGANSVPPGLVNITADTTTAALGNNAVQEIASDPNNTTPLDSSMTAGVDYRTLEFNMDNPIAVEVYDAVNNPTSIGVTAYSYDKGAQANGNPNLGIYTNTDPATMATITTNYTNQLMQSLGFNVDGSSGTVTFNIYDRSDMALLLPPGTGLSTIRFNRPSLQWQLGANGLINPLNPPGNPNLYPNFEDLPVNSPNNSLDYPDITADALSFTVNPNGNAGNPVQQTVTLNPPDAGNGSGGDSGTPLTTGNNASQRYLKATPVTMTINVPQYQPANGDYSADDSTTGINTGDLFSFLQADGSGNSDPSKEAEGYFGNLQIFVDSFGSGTLTSGDAFRLMNIATGVSASYRLQVNTPTVDLGSLSSGALYSPPTSPVGNNPWSPGAQDPLNGNASPWNGAWNGVYKPFVVQSNSNVNVLPLRLAKGSTTTGSMLPWGIYSQAGDFQSWLDGSMNLWSNLDSHYAMPLPNSLSPATANQVMIQKPRVGDRTGTTLDVNPHPRINPNLGVTSGAANLNPAYNGIGPNPHTPAVAVSLPPGTPAGTYSTNAANQLRTIMDVGANPEVWDTYLSGDEPATDPGIQLSYTVTDTRLTTTNSANVAPMIDNIPAPTNLGAVFKNISPAAMRDAYGSVIVAWASDRYDTTTGNPTQSPASQPTSPVPNDATRIYVASMANTSGFSANSASAGITAPSGFIDPITGLTPTSPLLDLNFFQPASSTAWFGGQTASAHGFPDTTGSPGVSLFTADPGATLIRGTEKYGLPMFPLSGEKDPLWATDGNANNMFESGSFMAFVGSIQEQTGSGRVQKSQVFVSSVSTASTGGTVTLGTPASDNDDQASIKGKPSVAQIHQSGGDEAFVFYPATAANQTQIHVATFGSTVSKFYALNFGTGFENVDQPSATLRSYQGTNVGLPAQLIDLTFAGKLRGRPSSEIYLGRLRVGIPTGGANYSLIDSSNNDVIAGATGAGSPFAFMPTQAYEPLVNEGHGTYRARGVEWDRTQPVNLYMFVNGTPTSIVQGTAYVDRQSGLISYTSTFGGKVFIDPELGTVRFTSGQPPQTADIRLTYTPAFIRVTDGTEGSYSDPSGIYDDHYLSDFTMWFNATGAAVGTGDNVQSDRSMFLYERSATGGGQTAQPFYSTMRFGVLLPAPVYTNSSGAITLSVTGNRGAYEVDPAAGRVYFTAQDEDNTVSITYTATDLGTGNAQSTPTTITGAAVSYVPERTETPVVIDHAVNEGSLSTFMDPFSYQTSTAVMRPPLIWMFYSSTRGGSPDVYFQTIAPRFTPVLK